jgi:hypothetical protein
MLNFITIILISGLCYVQTGWDLLATTRIKKGYDAFLDEEIDKPDFPESLRKMNGQKITLEGYIIPLQQAGSQDYFVLSRFPYQSCFFCGAAGPETVVEVYALRSFKFTDERVRVTGTLELNADDPLHLFFLLRDCTVQSM